MGKLDDGTGMLTYVALKSLEPTGKSYKAADREGVYVSVSKTGTKTFRYDCRVNG